jgi:hypothetical protein
VICADFPRVQHFIDALVVDSRSPFAAILKGSESAWACATIRTAYYQHEVFERIQRDVSGQSFAEEPKAKELGVGYLRSEHAVDMFNLLLNSAKNHQLTTFDPSADTESEARWFLATKHQILITTSLHFRRHHLYPLRELATEPQRHESDHLEQLIRGTAFALVETLNSMPVEGRVPAELEATVRDALGLLPPFSGKVRFTVREALWGVEVESSTTSA